MLKLCRECQDPDSVPLVWRPVLPGRDEMRLLISLEMTITMMMQMILRSQGEECGCHRETEPGWRHQSPDNGQVFAQLLGPVSYLPRLQS